MLPVLLVILSMSVSVPSSIRKIEITNETKGKPIQINIASNRITSVRFNRVFDAKTLFCGDTHRFLIDPIGDAQINFKGATSELGLDTNCTMLTKTGTPVVLNLVLKDSHKADAFVDVIFATNDLPATELELTRRLQQVEETAKEQLAAVEKECQDKEDNNLTKQVAEAIVSRHIDARAIASDVILTVKDFVKIGQRGLIRIMLDNQSRDSYAAGLVKLSFSIAGKDAVRRDVNVYYQQPVIDRNERTFGAISFNMVDLPENARFTLQVIESNGSRNPQVTGLRL